ncbi:TBC1 domain family member 5 isoform X2 [Rhodnius prolixus]|uniref:TBC1 domain family member 5 isoform X2 n=1 Tax=Rhodnius prolixus TaxID=13249 RepID=UPI003D188F13
MDNGIAEKYTEEYLHDMPCYILDNFQVDMAQDVLVLNAKAMKQKSTSSLGLKYEEEWDKLCKENLELTVLRKRALEGELRASRFRSVIWRLLLGALTPGSSNIWSSEAEISRKHYSTLKKSLCITPCKQKEPNYDNPLSQHDKSTWHQYFCDKELRSLIRQDVIRTFPGVDFFRGEIVQEAMINILFCYARENPTMCYRQGMHEVLAPVLFVVHCDQQAFVHAQEQGYIRTLFRRIMNAIEGSYLISNLEPTSTGHFPACSFAMSSSNENQVIAQLNWIKERLLAPTDPQLHNHLEKFDIPLPLFGIRWLRLLFGREFPLQDLLVLWDAIFADNKSFDLVNYIVVAMLVAIRNILLTSDYTASLTNLMRYPTTVDISNIIEYALHLKNPKRYKAPSKFYFTRNSAVIDGRNNFCKNHEHNRIKLSQMSSLKMKTESMNRIHTPTAPLDPNIIEGYALNDPEVLSVELRNAHTVMSLCRLKLLQYHHILEKVVPPNDAQAQQALTGIHELSSLLNTKKTTNTGINIDPAYEAGERLDSSTPHRTKPNSPINENELTRKPSVDMTVFKHVAIPISESDNDLYKSWKLL